jgi:peptide/nickel transport system substrate-binding protein
MFLAGYAIFAILTIFLFNTSFDIRAQNEKKGAFIDGARFIQYLDDNVALQEIKAGNLDTYYFRVPLEVVPDIKNNPNLKEYDRNAGTFGVLLNPAPSKTADSVNPFQFKKIRFAVNYLINRDFVVNEILKGFGTPIVDPFGVYSPEYLNVLDTIESFGFRYNPHFANKMISDALTSAGAVNRAGKWTFNNKPIIIKMLIRNDDPQRRSVGELIASEFEKVGFVVQRDFGDLNKANSIVYGSDPQDFQWHVYTEAYAGTSAFVKYNPVITSQMYAPYFGRMPGGTNPSFWHYQNVTLDKITQRIAFFNFTSQHERNELVKNATKAGIQESVRIFIAQNTDPFVASSSLRGLVNDFGAGITSKYSLINARTSKVSNSLDIGVKQIYQGAWNNVAGCKDAYCTEIYSAVTDSAIFRNPYTGEAIPMRENWTDISTKGPLGKLKVPHDAQIWDSDSQSWRHPLANASAMSKVTYKILYSKWHNGINMDRSDILYPQYFLFEWGSNKGMADHTSDPEYTSQAQVALPLVKGIRFIANDMVESYVDIWHYDKKEIADSASIWPSEPWEITAATERLVTSGKLAYSKGEATAKNVDWLSLLIPEHAEMIKSELQKMKNENFIPSALKGIVNINDAGKRYDSTINWITRHHNAVIGNGPFYLDSYNPTGAVISIKSFRDQSYPFSQGHWASFENPKLATVENVEAPQFISMGHPIKIQVQVKVGGKPSNDALVNYFVLDKNSKIAIHGVAQHLTSTSESDGIFTVLLNGTETSRLSFGPAVLKIFANSKEASRPDVYTTTLVVINNSTSLTEPKHEVNLLN